MVKVREVHPLLANGQIDFLGWINQSLNIHDKTSVNDIYQACLVLQKYSNNITTPFGISCTEQGLMIAEILNNLGLGIETIIAGILYDAIRYAKVPLDLIKDMLGKQVAALINGVQNMDNVHARNNLFPNNSSNDDIKKHNIQNLRKMLLAVVEDIRVVLIKLAEHTCNMRAAIKAPDIIRKQLAHESFDIYAPLANRLGIGQIKWELEDLAFRFLEPTIYKNVANLLDEKRADREKYINSVILQLKSALNRHNIESEVFGRVKHIYSIWRKMQRKMVSYSEIYDVRAIRIIVPSLVECYAALGVVHTLWQHIPKEFDDYIASPKPNGYRSLHTAVVGSDGKVLEVQIRTNAMHQQAELGVAAHWRYKEDAKIDVDYEKRINNLRQLLSWQDEITLDKEQIETLQAEFFEDRVYVFTPRGDVVDLPKGATPIDFAYHIHTDIGHRCRGAKINGNMAPLSQVLKNGVQIEILTAKNGGPSRDWLNPHLKYLVTSKAKAKIHQWFKRQDRELNIQCGREILSRELKRLGYNNINIKELVNLMHNCNNEEDLLVNIGNGDIKASQIQSALYKLIQPKLVHVKNPIKPLKPVKDISEFDVTVAGIGNLLCHMARCCKPVPGDEIIGYITTGEGVAVHRQDCINILQIKDKKKIRLIEVAWGSDIRNQYMVDININAYNRRGLLRDITTVLAGEHVDVVNMVTLTNKNDNMAHFKLQIEVSDIEMLGRVLTKIQQIANVIEAFRVDS